MPKKQSLAPRKAIDRKRMARALKTWRGFDKGARRPDVERAYNPDLAYANYVRYLGTDFIQFLRARKSKVRRMNVFDAGCGKGSFLSHVKNEFGEGVFTEGLALAHFKSKGIDRLHVGHIDKFKLPKRKYDLVVSHAGATFYSFDPLARTGEIIDALKSGGDAFLDYSSRLDLAELKALCASKDVALTVTRSNRYYTAVHITKTIRARKKVPA
ncbi:MAG: hypothetical protein JW772_02965 [Candidatus Diapherotrites archaeon]|nr:hypothetical protein [Candidatus Diapherotrites archaeon]